jgi:hypothetical protein
LLLFDNFCCFRANTAMASQDVSTVIPFSNIVKLERQRTSLGVLDNGLVIDTKERLSIPLEYTSAGVPGTVDMICL